MAEKKITDVSHTSTLINSDSIFVNKDNLLTQINMADFQNLIQKSAITVYPSSTQALTTDYAKMTMNMLFASVGDAFTMSNGGIIVNKKCAIEVSASAVVTGLTSGDQVNLQLLKNDVNLSTFVINKAGSNTLQVVGSPIIVNAVAGDHIAIAIINSTAARGTASNYTYTRLTVKEV